MKEAAEPIAELRGAEQGDHERGCEGRSYTCSCGYDARMQAAATSAADHIETLEARVATLSAEAKHYPTVAGENMRLREALNAARASIVSGCDTIHAIAAIDRNLAAREASR